MDNNIKRMSPRDFGFNLRQNGKGYMGNLALERIAPYIGDGMADEIFARNGCVVFRYGGYEYSLWCYSVLTNPISDVMAAFHRAKRYYRQKLEGDKKKENANE